MNSYRTAEIATLLSDAQTKIIVIKFFYLPINAQENCFKKNIKIYIKTAATCFGAIIIIIIIIRDRII